MKLNLGALDRRFEGFLSVDIVPPADIVTDLSQPWPWPDSSVDEVLAYDVFEHLPDIRHALNELWRVLNPGARATIQVPNAANGDGGFCDPTHRSYWTRSTFEYFCKGIAERERFRTSPYYGVTADFRILNLLRDGSLPGTMHRRVFGGTVEELHAVLEAMK